jgi:homoserine kinase type II
MGSFLGHLHQILRDYPHEQVSQSQFTFDLETTLMTIDTIEKAIRSLPSTSDEDEQALARLVERRLWLITASPVNMGKFLALGQQVIHGDYQETNLFFENGQVSAVIDWDKACVAPRAWEVLRTLHYALRLEKAACRAFLDAYRRVLPLPSTDLEITAEAYGWMQAHNLWHYKAVYLEDNQRVRAFLGPGPFIPFAQKWAILRDALYDN